MRDRIRLDEDKRLAVQADLDLLLGSKLLWPDRSSATE